MNWILAVMPFLIGIHSICMLKGWILIRPHDTRFSEAWVKRNKFALTGTAVLSTGAGICGILLLSGLIKIQGVP